MKLIDTNVVMYAVGRPHPYKDACALLLRDVTDGIGSFNLDTELLQEVRYVYTARGQRPFALEVCSRLLRSFRAPFPVAREEIVEAHDLMSRYPFLLPRDAIHAAVVKTYDLEGIVSADKVFDAVGEVKRFDPLALYPPGR